MKRRLIYFLCILSFAGYSQTDFGIKLGANHPIKYKYDVHRKTGAELGFLVHHNIKNNIGIEYGFMADAFGRIKQLPDFDEDTRYITFSFFMPVLATYRLAETKFSIKGGFVLGLKNALTFTRYTGIFVGGLSESVFSFPTIRHPGVDAMLELNYAITKHLQLYSSFRTPFIYNKDHFGVISLGTQFVF